MSSSQFHASHCREVKQRKLSNLDRYGLILSESRSSDLRTDKSNYLKFILVFFYKLRSLLKTVPALQGLIIEENKLQTIFLEVK